MIEALENISAHAVRRVECAFYCIAVGHALQLSAIGAPGIYIYIYQRALFIASLWGMLSNCLR
jgi:hypothetical protein